MTKTFVVPLNVIGMHDVAVVGGKNASLGEMIQNLSHAGVNVPGGYATTADAFKKFLEHDGLNKRIFDCLGELDVDDVVALAAAGKQIRGWVMQTPLPDRLEHELRDAYAELESQLKPNCAVAVRSSATAEDLPDASFAGQQETYLNIRGIEAVLLSVKQVFASLYNDRAIAYRVHQQFDHEVVALSAGIQQMVRSDIGSSGVMFTLDTESGFSDVVFITGAFGLGETVVQGSVNPDEFYVFKPTLSNGYHAIVRRSLGSKQQKMIYANNGPGTSTTTVVDVDTSERNRFCLRDEQVELLARYAIEIERHYQRPMDIEWALDGIDSELYIVQARPETVKSRDTAQHLERYQLQESGDVLITGRAIGQRIGAGQVRVIDDVTEMARVQTGDVLVTDMTDPDWEPVMKRASAIITNRGGRTCHAAIIARELGIPAVVGSGNATELINDGADVTVCCAEGETGKVYAGILDFVIHKSDVATMPQLPVKIMMNVGNPERAFHFAQIPNAGVGLARIEFVINSMIGVHPMALLQYEQQNDDMKQAINDKMRGFDDPLEFYVSRLTEGIATIAASVYPRPVIVRMSDFKSNEYSNLLAGEQFEPNEENPMIGFRGASRYVSEQFEACFALECKALKRVRETMGFNNVQVMVPFTRTVDEAKQVVARLDDHGLKREPGGLKIIMMCEIPSNALIADQFLEYFDGFSIGSNDLTQLTLGLDRDSSLVAHLFDERNPAVKTLLQMAIEACRRKNKYVGICGQGPSDYPDLAKWLLEQGIDSISLNPDTVVGTWLYLANEGD